MRIWGPRSTARSQKTVVAAEFTEAIEKIRSSGEGASRGIEIDDFDRCASGHFRIFDIDEWKVAM